MFDGCSDELIIKIKNEYKNIKDLNLKYLINK